MNESRWEASRRSARKSGIIIFLVFIAVSVVSGILFVNNRDLIDGAPHEKITVLEKNTALAAEAVPERTDLHSVDIDSAYAREGRPTAVPSKIDTVHHDSSRKLPAITTAAKPTPVPVPAAVRQKPAIVIQPAVQAPPKALEPLPAATPVPASIKVPPFACRVDSRKDVVIYLSLELFFEDAEKRSSLLLRREDIKVMVMRTLRGNELGEITTGKLEEELRGAINKLFDHSEIVAVKISDIRIEKAVKE